MMHMHSTNYLTGQIYFLTCRSRDLDDPAHHAHCEARGLSRLGTTVVVFCAGGGDRGFRV